jgi:hypothetical protein
MVRSKAKENLHKFSLIIYEMRVHLEGMPYREFGTPAGVKGESLQIRPFMWGVKICNFRQGNLT